MKGNQEYKNIFFKAFRIHKRIGEGKLQYKNKPNHPQSLDFFEYISDMISNSAEVSQIINSMGGVEIAYYSYFDDLERLMNVYCNVSLYDLETGYNKMIENTEEISGRKGSKRSRGFYQLEGDGTYKFNKRSKKG